MAEPRAPHAEPFFDPDLRIREKRRHRRTPVPRGWDVDCEVASRGVRSGRWRNLPVVDISDGGIRVEFPPIGFHPESGDAVTLGLRYGDLRLEARGRVRHIEDVGLGSRIGIEFGKIEDRFLGLVRAIADSVRAARRAKAS